MNNIWSRISIVQSAVDSRLRERGSVRWPAKQNNGSRWARAAPSCASRLVPFLPFSPHLVLKLASFSLLVTHFNPKPHTTHTHLTTPSPTHPPALQQLKDALPVLDSRARAPRGRLGRLGPPRRASPRARLLQARDERDAAGRREPQGRLPRHRQCPLPPPLPVLVCVWARVWDELADRDLTSLSRHSSPSRARTPRPSHPRT